MKSAKESPSNNTPVSDKVKIPVYSSIKMVDGKPVGKFEEYIEMPIELIRKETNRKEN